MLETYEEYLKRTNKKDSKYSWIHWKMDVYKYPKEKAVKRAETQYFPLNPIDMEQTIIGLNIKYLRTSRFLTKNELMKALNIKDNCLIHRWEKGIYIPTAAQTQMLADFFNVSVSDLIGTRLYSDNENIIKKKSTVSDEKQLYKGYLIIKKRNHDYYICTIQGKALRFCYTEEECKRRIDLNTI